MSCNAYIWVCFIDKDRRLGRRIMSARVGLCTDITIRAAAGRACSLHNNRRERWRHNDYCGQGYVKGVSDFLSELGEHQSGCSDKFDRSLHPMR